LRCFILLVFFCCHFFWHLIFFVLIPYVDARIPSTNNILKLKRSNLKLCVRITFNLFKFVYHLFNSLRTTFIVPSINFPFLLNIHSFWWNHFCIQLCIRPIRQLFNAYFRLLSIAIPLELNNIFQIFDRLVCKILSGSLIKFSIF
jgi:hypothetical protein